MPGLLAPNSTHYGPGSNQTFFARDTGTSPSSAIILDTSGSILAATPMLAGFQITETGSYAISVNINLQNSPTDVIDTGLSGNGNSALGYYLLDFNIPGNPKIKFVGNTIKSTTLVQASAINGVSAISPPLDYTYCSVVTLTPGNYAFQLKGYTSAATNSWALSNILVRVLKIS